MSLEQEEAVLILASMEALLAGNDDLVLQGDEVAGLVLILTHVRQIRGGAKPPYGH